MPCNSENRFCHSATIIKSTTGHPIPNAACSRSKRYSTSTGIIRVLRGIPAGNPYKRRLHPVPLDQLYNSQSGTCGLVYKRPYFDALHILFAAFVLFSDSREHGDVAVVLWADCYHPFYAQAGKSAKPRRGEPRPVFRLVGFC